MAKLLNIFEFSDYRAYLKEWIAQAKKEQTFSLARLGKVAGVHPTFLSHVLSGTKHLSLEQAAAISAHLGHSKLELDYLVVLINLDRAGTPILRDYFREKKAQLEKDKNKLSQRFEKHQELSGGQRVIFYSSWLYAAIWASTAINDGQTLEQVARRFSLRKAQAAEVLDFLTQTGVCNEAGGVYSMGAVHVHVPNESPHVVKHHMNWRMKAVQKLDSREEAELFFSAPMSISKADVALLREKLNAAIKDTVTLATNSKAEEVVCLNIDFFKPGA